MKDIKSLGKEVYVMPPRDPATVDFINKSISNFKKALKKGEDFRLNPQFSSQNKCPRCGSGRYFLLYGGAV